MSGLYDEPIDICVNFDRKPNDVLVKEMESTMDVACWFRAAVPLMIALATYMCIACSPLRPGFCLNHLPPGQEAFESRIHTALNTRPLLHGLYKIDWFGGGFLSCAPLFMISLVTGLVITALFEVFFWIAYGRPGFAFIWLLAAAVACMPICF